MLNEPSKYYRFRRKLFSTINNRKFSKLIFKILSGYMRVILVSIDEIIYDLLKINRNALFTNFYLINIGDLNKLEA